MKCNFEYLGWKDVFELTLLQQECEYFIKHKAPIPICGYELVFNDDTNPKYISKFASAGWNCYLASLSETEFEEILTSIYPLYATGCFQVPKRMPRNK